MVCPRSALRANKYCSDTQYYWGLTRNIFRYSHLRDADFYNGLHTVNEGTSFWRAERNRSLTSQRHVFLAVRGEAWIQSIRFYTQFILNCDEHLKVGNF